MAERLIAAVLKTAVGDEPTVGSNPSLSANTSKVQKPTRQMVGFLFVIIFLSDKAFNSSFKFSISVKTNKKAC